MQKTNLFREVAVNRLSSPEELDNLLQVTSPRGWIALAGVGLLVVGARDGAQQKTSEQRDQASHRCPGRLSHASCYLRRDASARTR